MQRASRGEGVARFPPPRPNWKNGNNKSRLLGGLHGGLHERPPKGLQRGAEKRGEGSRRKRGRGDGGGGWLSRWDGDGVGGCAQCSMRPGPDRLIGNTHRSSCARGISHVCSIVGGDGDGGGGGGEGKKSGAGGGRRRKGGGKRGGHIA